MGCFRYIIVNRLHNGDNRDNNNNIYYLCVATTALRPITERAHKHEKNTQIIGNKRKHIEKR